MPRTLLHWLGGLGSLLLLLCWGASAAAVLVDGVAAVVNDDVILQSELLELLEPYRQEYAAKYDGRELQDRIRATARALLDAAIERQLLLQEAKRLEAAGRGIEIEESRVDEPIQKARERFDSDEEFRDALAEYGETMATFRKRREEELLARKVAALKWQQIDKEVTVLEQEVQGYYEKHREDFAIQPEKQFFKVFVPADASVPASERAVRRGMMEEVLAEVESGADIERLAERLGDGDTGVPVEVGRGDLPSELEREIRSMQEEEISHVLESREGFYIVKVLRAGSRQGFDHPQVRAKIESILRAERVQERYSEWLKKLRENARVSIYFR